MIRLPLPVRLLPARLLRDRAGNVLVIVAACLLPLLAMLGAGIDLSRAYMAQVRLQQACDAGALAGRRAMTDGTVDAGVIAEARKFFAFNFPTGTAGRAGSAAYGAAGFDPAVSAGAGNTVTIAAATTLPTTIMRMFGFADLTISARCDARLDLVNTDIVLVLDTTGSMAEKAAASDADTKIAALRKAVLAFFDTLAPMQAQLEASGLRLRYAVVPYSSAANVGRLIQGAGSGYLVSDKWTYQSRTPLFLHVQAGFTQSQCDDVDGTTSLRVPLLDTYTCTWSDGNSVGGTFTAWFYRPMTWDVSGYVTGGATPVPTRTPYTTQNATWAGCIEERRTTSALTGSSSSIPAAAMDLDIDLVPTGDQATKWKPYWPEVEYTPYNSNIYSGDPHKPQYACPGPARRLQAWTRGALSSYLDGLAPDGGTYHDIGMLWGIRMLSSAGIFASDNPAAFNGQPVSRFLIFMTDGKLDTGYDRLYTGYGVERLDARATPGGALSSENDQYARHLRRFDLLCAAARTRAVSTWVVAFDQALTASLSACASNAAQASTAASQPELVQRFQDIGRNIGALRLSH